MQAEEFALPNAGETRSLFLSGPAGRIETILSMPAGELRGGCVVCHPHPLFSGTMTNKVAHMLASCALEAGLAALRFNFRGVGGSEGVHDEGRGETDDTVLVSDMLRGALTANAPLVLAGFSFGAYVALKAAATVHPALQVSVGIPLSKYVDVSAGLPPGPGCPWLSVHGTADEVVSYADTRAVLDTYSPPPRQVAVEGGSHFFHGRLVELKKIVLPFLEEGLSGRRADAGAI